MKRWYYWFWMALAWVPAVIEKLAEGKNPTINIIQVTVFALLAPCQLVLEKKGEKGKKILNGIYIVVIVACVSVLLAVIFTPDIFK